jgi:hypothetical protein
MLPTKYAYSSGVRSGGAMVWTALTTIAVPANATTEYRVGSVSGTFRARISTTVTGGTVTVLGIRPEEQRARFLSCSVKMRGKFMRRYTA